MSQENVEIVRDLIDAINRRDWDAVLEHLTPDFKYDASRSIGTRRGVYERGEMRQMLDDFFGAWESFRYEANEFIEVGEHMVMPYTTYVRGRDRIEVQASATHVFTIRDGAIAHICLYQSKEGALEAVGLSE